MAGAGVVAPLTIRSVSSVAPGTSLEELMVAYTQGSASAFDDLYRQLSPKVFGYLLRLTRNRERAEDLLQITFTKIHRARASYLPGAPVVPWVLAIARRSFFDERRSAKVRPEDLSSDGSLPEPVTIDHEIPTDVAGALEQALTALPEPYREAIELTKVSGLSVAQAAEVLGTSATAVKLRVHRGYNALRSKLERFNRKSNA